MNARPSADRVSSFAMTVVNRARAAFHAHDAKNPNDPNRTFIKPVVEAEAYLSKHVPANILDDLAHAGFLNKASSKYYLLLK